MARVHEIARMHSLLNTIEVPAFRLHYARMVANLVEAFAVQGSFFSEPLASEFHKLANEWLVLARGHEENAEAILSKECVPQLFRAGPPVNRDHVAFVPRHRVIADLVRQSILTASCPGLILYGRKRMGKTTVLLNLRGFLPAGVHVVMIPMDQPRSFTSLASFVGKVCDDLKATFPNGPVMTTRPTELIGLFDTLSTLNDWLEQTNQRLLLAFDEYEFLDMKIGSGVFPEDLLATIRASIQAHQRLTWIFTGSHEISELTHASWAAYLMNIQTIHVSFFTPDETGLLLTEPLEHSRAPIYTGNQHRPRFTPDFWGEGGINAIHSEANGWPHLVQLLAGTIVDLLNDEGSRRVDARILDRALDKVIVSGHNVFFWLLRQECRSPEEWAYLSRFGHCPAQPTPEDEAVRNSLFRRLLIEEDRGQCHLRVPLMRRWLQQRA